MNATYSWYIRKKFMSRVRVKYILTVHGNFNLLVAVVSAVLS